jgi:hypothetical protein
MEGLKGKSGLGTQYVVVFTVDWWDSASSVVASEFENRQFFGQIIWGMGGKRVEKRQKDVK